jgi:hypothetical protein
MGNSIKNDSLFQGFDAPRIPKPLFNAIVADLRWLMTNGLVDVNRDVLMKLIKIVDNDEKTRNVCEFLTL